MELHNHGFEAPDVREASLRNTVNVPGAKYNVFKPGLNYHGRCSDPNCVTHNFKKCERMLTIVDGKLCYENKFFGTTSNIFCPRFTGQYRFIEDLEFGEIKCPACKEVFYPESFDFFECSASIKYCLKGEKPVTFSFTLPEDGSKYMRLGGPGEMPTYTILIMDVKGPGHYSNDFSALTNTNSVKLTLRNCNQISHPKMRSPGFGSKYNDQPQYLDPTFIRYIQDSIGSKFGFGQYKGRRVMDTLAGLISGRYKVEEIPKIHVFRDDDGTIFSADNRRLYCFKKAGIKEIPVHWVRKQDVLSSKFTTVNGGISIHMRY